MALRIVLDSSELFIELHCRRVPFQDLKVYPLEAAVAGKPGDDADHCLAEAVPTIRLIDKNVLDVIATLPAKACEVGIEDGIGDRPILMKPDKAFNECTVAEHHVVKPIFGDLTVVAELFILGKVAHQPND